MRISGQFTTMTGAGALCALDTQPEKLSAVPTLADVVPTVGGGFTALFTPATPFGRQPIAARIVIDRADGTGAAVRVHGRRGPHVIDVGLTIAIEEAPHGTVVTWEAEVGLRGPAASVGQRVACDVAGRAIGELLVCAAACV